MATPEVSIVIPSFNHPDLTLRCLDSIERAKDATSREIIVVDDASTDPGVEAVARRPGIIFLRKEVNEGYTHTANHGARHARGRYLFFLNNDTEVTDGYLEWLLDIFRRFPKAGAVGCKLIYPDGTLQEGGSTIYRHGRGMNFGKLLNPDNFRVAHVREVAYCTAAALLVRRDLFMDIGLFDEVFAPAYYEDPDLQFRLRKAGWRVYYQPKSVVIHHEGATCGQDEGENTTGLKRFQALHRPLFVERHKAELEKHAWEKDPYKIDVQVFPRDLRHVFVFETAIPTPERDAGSLRSIHLLRMLQEHRQVSLVPAVQQAEPRHVDALTQDGIRVVIGCDNLTQFLAQFRDVTDAVIVSRPEAGILLHKLIRDSFGKDVPLIFDTVDLHCERAASLQEQDHDAARRKYMLYRAIETFLARDADRVWTVSEEERKIVASWGVPLAAIDVVPIIMDPAPTPATFDTRSGLLFLGGPAHQPNLEAVRYFASSIYPLIDLSLDVVGPGWDAAAILDATAIHKLGFVDDLASVFNTHLAACFPLVSGAGMKGKVAHAMAAGLPVITTPFGAQGYQGAEDALCIGATPAELADWAKKLTTNAALWQQKREAGLRFIERHLSREVVARRVEEILGRIKTS